LLRRAAFFRRTAHQLQLNRSYLKNIEKSWGGYRLSCAV
jgi:hypothetical protein